MKDGRFLGELILFSAVAGAIAALLKLLVHHIFIWLGLAKGFYNMMTAYLTHGHYHVEGVIEWLFGKIADISIGAIFAIILGFWLRFSRPKYHLWIGLGFGLGIWFASLAFGNLTKIIKDDMTDPWSLFAHLVAMSTFGVSFVLLARFWKPLKDRIMESSESGISFEEEKPRAHKFMRNLIPHPVKKLIRAKKPRKYKKPDKLIRLKRFI